MTTATPDTAPAPTTPAGPPDRYVHLYCCDPDVALCGADVSQHHDVPESADEELCPLCEVIDNLGTACRPDCADWT